MKTLRERFWEKVDIRAAEECWNWKASTSNKRYGNIKVDGKMIKAHRLSYILSGKKIKPGYCVLHKCDNGLCVNPSHLFTGTHADNMKDCAKKGRVPNKKGSANGNSKLAEGAVIKIRSEYKSTKKYGTLSRIARKHNVTPATIFDIVNLKTWKHLNKLYRTYLQMGIYGTRPFYSAPKEKD